MKKMNVFACFVALLHCVWSQTPSPAICQAYIDSNNCDFYRDCVETRANCGEDGYPLGYGYKYCQRFADLSNMFDEQVTGFLCIKSEIIRVLFCKSCI